MTLTMGLRYKNPDSSTDINLRLKDVAAKGFVMGADLVPVPGFAQIQVTPFACINVDGAVVRSDATETLNVGLGLHYIVLRARYVLLGSPILELQALSAAAFAGASDPDSLHVIGTTNRVGADVLASEIDYTLRAVVDPQARSPWREPVDFVSDLPGPPGMPVVPHSNREGDIRLVLDPPGSLHFWDGSAWQPFASVPEMVHRQHEHTNGITGDSAANTLETTVAGTTIVVTPIAPGSGYTCDGLYVTSAVGSGPEWTAPQTLDLPTSSLAGRGLVQIFADDAGVLDYEFRASLVGVNTIPTVRIVGISDDHSASGPFVLTATVGPDTLSWDGGPAVAVTTGNRYRLFRNFTHEWIEVDFSGVLGAATESWNVVASKKDETHVLLGNHFWDSTGPLAIQGQDARYFGNLDYAQLSSDLKRDVLEPPLNELRGDGVFEGGVATESPAASLFLQVTPIVAYIQGKRLLVAGRDASAPALTASATTSVFVDEDGVLQAVTTGYPATPHAKVATVVTNGTQITSISDTRDSFVRLSSVASIVTEEIAGGLTQASFVDEAGSISDLRVRAGQVHAESGDFSNNSAGTALEVYTNAAVAALVVTNEGAGAGVEIDNGAVGGTGPGLSAAGGGNSPGVDAFGSGTGAGVRGRGGLSGGTGPGLEGIGGSTSGPGVRGTGFAPNSNGVEGQGVGAGDGVVGTSDDNAASYGVSAVATGASGRALSATGRFDLAGGTANSSVATTTGILSLESTGNTVSVSGADVAIFGGAGGATLTTSTGSLLIGSASGGDLNLLNFGGGDIEIAADSADVKIGSISSGGVSISTGVALAVPATNEIAINAAGLVDIDAGSDVTINAVDQVNIASVNDVTINTTGAAGDIELTSVRDVKLTTTGASGDIELTAARDVAITATDDITLSGGRLVMPIAITALATGALTASFVNKFSKALPAGTWRLRGVVYSSGTDLTNQLELAVASASTLDVIAVQSYPKGGSPDTGYGTSVTDVTFSGPSTAAGVVGSVSFDATVSHSSSFTLDFRVREAVGSNSTILNGSYIEVIGL